MAECKSGKAKVLVIGGTGLMGVPTVRQLLSEGYDVSILSRGRGRGQGLVGAAPDIPEGASMVTCDRKDTNAFQTALVGFDVVVDFVVQSTADLDGIIAAHKCRPLSHYLFISTNMVYPGGPESWDISRPAGDAPWQEEDADVAKRAAEAPEGYGGNKLRCELALQNAYAEFGLPFTTFRPPAVIGPRCDSRYEQIHRRAVGLPPMKIAKKDYNKDAQHPGGFQIVFCEDVAKAIVAAISMGAVTHGQAFNIAQGEEQTLVDFVCAVQKSVVPRAASAPTMPDPEAVVAELTGLNFPCQGRLSIEKARKKLGWTPIPVADFLQGTSRWHEENMTVSPKL